jgi:hypothetical protein
MYHTYESFFVTGAQSWRIQKYGRVWWGSTQRESSLTHSLKAPGLNP